MYYLQSRYYNPQVGRFISADNVDLLGANGDFASLNLFAYCGNNPISRKDEGGEAWTLALAGGGIAGLGSGMSLGALLKTAAVAAGTIAPTAVVVVGLVAIVGTVCVATEFVKSKGTQDKGGRITDPIGRRTTFNTRKKAYEAAKKDSGGKEPRHDPNGHDGDNRPHFHPNVTDKFRKTPKGISFHDHYYYPR